MAKCLVCGTEFNENQSNKCTCCDFPWVNIVGDENSEQAKAYRKMAADKRKEFIGRMELFIVAKEWEANDQEYLVLAREQNLSFGKCSDLKLGETCWLDEPFARIPADKVTLTLAVKNGDEPMKKMSVSVKVPAGEEFWFVGVSMEEGLKVQLHLKTSREECRSELIDIRA